MASEKVNSHMKKKHRGLYDTSWLKGTPGSKLSPEEKEEQALVRKKRAMEEEAARLEAEADAEDQKFIRDVDAFY